MTEHELFEAACEEHAMKATSEGESPLECPPEKTSSWRLIETEGYVIYGHDEPPQPPSVEPPQPRVPVYSDDFLTRNSRRVYRTFMIEEIYKDGQTTHTFRAVRQRKDRKFDIAVFTTLDEAVEWGKGSAPGSLVF